MKTSSVVILLAAGASALPSLKRNPVKRDFFAKRDMELCQQAANCEIYEAPEGRRIRFVPGTEPGTASYNQTFGITDEIPHAHLARRQDEVTTNPTIGPDKLLYGSVWPADAMGRLRDGCPESGSCIQRGIEVETTMASPTNAYQTNVILTPTGQYAPGTFERDAFVDAIAACLNEGTETEDKTWANGGGAGQWSNPQQGTVTVHKQSNFVSVNRFQGGNLQGFMTVNADLEVLDNAWCGVVVGVASAIVGAVNGLAGGFFGAVADPLCN